MGTVDVNDLHLARKTPCQPDIEELARGRKSQRNESLRRPSRSLSLDKRVVLDPRGKPSDDPLSSGLGIFDMFLIARLNDRTSYFFTWFCKRYRIRIGGQDLTGKSEIQRCPICLDMCTEAIELQCGHAFCRPCLTTSAANNMNSCALCRREQVIDPELLRTQLDGQGVLSLAQQLSIPSPPRFHFPKSAVSAGDGVRWKGVGLNLPRATPALTEEDGSQGEKTVSQLMPVDSTTTHGHLLYGPWGDVGAMTSDDLRRRWRQCTSQASTLPGAYRTGHGAEPNKGLGSLSCNLRRGSRVAVRDQSGKLPANQSARPGPPLLRRGWHGVGSSESQSCEKEGGIPSRSLRATACEGSGVGGMGSAELSARWRGLKRVSQGVGLADGSPSISANLSGSASASRVPPAVIDGKAPLLLSTTQPQSTEEVDRDSADDFSMSLTPDDTVGSASGMDLCSRWRAAFQKAESGVGALSVAQLAGRLALARGPQGVGDIAIAELRERWISMIGDEEGSRKYFSRDCPDRNGRDVSQCGCQISLPRSKGDGCFLVL